MNVQNKPESFKDIQYRFTQHMRDPDHAPAPEDVEDRRVEIYRGLLYRNVEGFMANSFPVLRKITPDEDWHRMLRDYFKNHLARTPLFPKMPQEFLQYLEHERDNSEDPPYLFELAHYEYAETAVAIDNRELSWKNIDESGDLLENVPVLSPLAWPLSYRYPVHRISKDYLPQEVPAQPTYIVVYRDRDDKVGFAELNPVSARLLELIQQDKDITGRTLLETIAKELNHPDPEVVINGGLEIMQDLLTKDILLGTLIS